jgi:Flp pilus assembly protein TadD
MKIRSTRTLAFAVGTLAGFALLASATRVRQNVATSTPVASGPAPQLAGSSTCRECHAPFYEKWATSHHGLAMQPFTPHLAARQLKPLAEPLVVRDCRYRVEFADEKGWVVESGPDGAKRYAMEHALGGKNVFYFLTPMERGRLQVLPVAYDVRRQEWFDTTGSAARGQMHFEDEVLDWRAPQLTFNTSCHGCHVSQFSSNYDPQTDAYHSEWAEPGISCETCHAGGSEHVNLFRSLPAGQKPDDIRIISTKKFSVEQLNALCAPCHAKSMPLTSSFRPGDRYFDNYDLAGPEHGDFHPDGRDLGENYTYTSWRMSPCVKSGTLSCMHCHTSSGRYRFAENSNQACLPCHPSHVEHATDHTHHQPDSTGNQCVACHMPMTEFARMRRSDHSMRPPTPGATLAFKSPNACNVCHTDKDAVWSDRYVRQWRSRDYQGPVLHIAGLVAAARQHDWTRLPEMLAYITNEDRDEMFAAALIRLVCTCEDTRKWPAFVQAIKDSSPLVRAAAAAGLENCPAPDGVATLLAATGDEYRLVRIRAAGSLAGFPRERLSEADRLALQRATDEFLTIARARPDDHASHYNLGNYYMARREFDLAVASFERAVQLLPDNVAPLVNASLAHNLDGRNEQAENCLRRALKVEPANAAANLNLGLLLGELGRLAEAETSLRAAFKSDPQSATAAYNLGIALAAERPDEAIEWCRKAHNLEPQEPKFTYTLAFYLHARGARDEAVTLLRTVTDQHMAYLDAYMLLGRIYEEGGRKNDAVELYRRAAAVEQFPAEVQRQFSSRAQWLSQRR